VDVRLQGDGVAALADHAHLSSFHDCVASRNTRRAELEQRHGVPVVSRDRDRVAAAGHDADKGDRPAGRCQYGTAEVRADVDASVLASRVRVGADGEWPQDGSVGRPGPGERARYRDQERQDGGHHCCRRSSHHL
jgi:hypothetical protein